MKRRGFMAALASLPFVGDLARQKSEPRQTTTIKTPWISTKTGKPVASGSTIRPCDVGHFIRMKPGGGYAVEFFDIRTGDTIAQPAGTRLHTREYPSQGSGKVWIDVNLEWT